jgi:hypothetical protein
VNAFDVDRWRELGALTPAARIDSLRAFHRRVAGDRTVLLVAFNSWTGTELARRLGVADEPHVAEQHTGITGAMLNVRLYQALRARGMTPVIE